MTKHERQGIAIRRAALADADEVGSLIVNELGYADLDLNNWTDRFQRISADSDYETLVALLGSEIVGFIGTQKCIAYEMEGCYLRVIALAVSANHQRMGIGKALLNYVEQCAFENSIYHITLNSSMARTDAHAFYERTGYTKRQFGYAKRLE